MEDDLIYGVISALCPKVKAVKLCNEGNRFSARLVMAVADKSGEADCPLAVALAIALREKVSIVTDEAVLNKAGISLPA